MSPAADAAKHAAALKALKEQLKKNGVELPRTIIINNDTVRSPTHWPPMFV